MKGLKTYRGVTYLLDKDGIWKVIIDDNAFVVALDDSKLGGGKRFFDEANSEEKCKEYIDWLLDF